MPVTLPLAHVRRTVAVALALAGLALIVAGCAGRTSRTHEEMWGPFRGRFVDADTGQPIPGALAYVIWLKITLTPVQSRQEYYAVHFAVSNHVGEYEIPALKNPPMFRAWHDGPLHSFAVAGYQRIETLERESYTVSRWRPFSRIPETERNYATSGLYTAFIPEQKAREMLERVNAARQQLGLPPFRTLRGAL